MNVLATRKTICGVPWCMRMQEHILTWNVGEGERREGERRERGGGRREGGEGGLKKKA